MFRTSQPSSPSSANTLPIIPCNPCQRYDPRKMTRMVSAPNLAAATRRVNKTINTLVPQHTLCSNGSSTQVQRYHIPCVEQAVNRQSSWLQAIVFRRLAVKRSSVSMQNNFCDTVPRPAVRALRLLPALLLRSRFLGHRPMLRLCRCQTKVLEEVLRHKQVERQGFDLETSNL